MTNDQKWRKTLKWFRDKYLPDTKLVVERRDRKNTKYHGYAEWRDTYFYVWVNKRQVFALQIDTLLHELAHVLSWNSHDDDEHGPGWGLAYAMLYREFIKWDYGEN